MRNLTTIFIATTASALVGCGTPTVPNPTGDCDPGHDGSRQCYHSPADTDTYLPDCQNPLNRELWRVFAQNEESAYIIPRPDGMGLEFGLCDEEGPFTTYGLCVASADPNVLNDIPPAIALEITNTLHQHLRFEVSEDGQYIVPWAPDEDVIAACDLTDNLAAQEHCANLSYRLSGGDTCIDIGYIPGEEAVAALVPALNELYGIE